MTNISFPLVHDDWTDEEVNNAAYYYAQARRLRLDTLSCYVIHMMRKYEVSHFKLMDMMNAELEHHITIGRLRNQILKTNDSSCLAEMRTAIEVLEKKYKE